LSHDILFFDMQNRFKQRIWIQGNRPEEEEIFEFTMFQVGSYVSLETL